MVKVEKQYIHPERGETKAEAAESFWPTEWLSKGVALINNR